MIKVSGKSVENGIAIGRIYLYETKVHQWSKTIIQDVKAELERVEAAFTKADKQLSDLYEKSLKDVGEAEAMIFEVHRMMLEDQDFRNQVQEMIEQDMVNAEFAIDTVGKRVSQIFASMEDEYMKARSADILDIAGRVVQNLCGGGDQDIDSTEPIILVAEDLTPSETVRMDKSKILAFVTAKGSANSHTAILARTMSIPSIVNSGIDLKPEYNGKMAIVDGYHGELIIEPDEELLLEMRGKRAAWLEETQALKQLIGKENVTSDGRSVKVFANIGKVEDMEKAVEADAGGIGLFRSEFIYLGREDYPTEEKQFAIYKKVVEGMNGKTVIIRTLDIGADKKVDYFQLDQEENPAMGYRAIRICLDRPEIFKTQLRAIYRASAFGSVGIMFPMIISEAEVVTIKKIVAEVIEELNDAKVAMGEVELGIMVETPAAVMMSRELAKHVDFFSIGTNDLTQYTLAIDRQNQKLENSYDSHHPAVLKLIQMTVENGHKEGIWVGICGELAADTSLTKTFLDMGVDELSVSSPYVLKLRKAIREL